MTKELMNDRLLTDIANKALENGEFTIDDLSEYITEETKHTLEETPDHFDSIEDIHAVHRDFAAALIEVTAIDPNEAINAEMDISAAEIALKQQQQQEIKEVSMKAYDALA